MQLNTVLLMAGWGVQALQLLASLSILIVLHEFGHFFFARLFKTRVEKFYLFFDFMFPFPNVLNFSLFKKKKGDTEYGVGWFPMGGYVKIAGMVDESMDEEQMKQPPQPWEYRSKKAWQRLFIMLGGIILNIITAMVIYALIFGIWGDEYIPPQNVKYGVYVDSLGKSIGLQDGDVLLGTDGVKEERYGRIKYNMIFNNAKTMEVLRDGEELSIDVPEGTVRQMIKNKYVLADIRVPFVIDHVAEGSLADKLDIKKGDKMVSFNGDAVAYYHDYLNLKKGNAGKDVTVGLMRNGKELLVTGKFGEDEILGVRPLNDLETVHIKYGPIKAVAKGFSYTYYKFAEYLDQFKFIFTSKEVKPSESIGGFASFGKGFSQEFDWKQFLSFTAFISIILAFMNLLPIPGLDGGYVFFLIFEMLTGKQVSDKVMGIANTVGLVLLLALMLYANGLDIVRAFK